MTVVMLSLMQSYITSKPIRILTVLYISVISDDEGDIPCANAHRSIAAISFPSIETGLLRSEQKRLIIPDSILLTADPAMLSLLLRSISRSPMTFSVSSSADLSSCDLILCSMSSRDDVSLEALDVIGANAAAIGISSRIRIILKICFVHILLIILS